MATQHSCPGPEAPGAPGAPGGLGGPGAPGAPSRPSGQPNVKELISSCLGNLLLPVVAYFVLRPRVPNDTVALAIAVAVPVVRTLWVWAARHRVDPLGVVGAAGYGAAVVVSFLTGGSALPVKFIEPAITALIGLALLGSLATGRPLILAVAHRGTPLRDLPPRTVHSARVVTAISGPALLLHAAVHIAFALTLSTGAFLVWSRVAGWGVLLVGAAVVYWYVRGRRRTA